MLEVEGDLWTYSDFSIRCITTNGFVKKNGEAVMGRGCAKEAAVKLPGLPAWLGRNIQAYGNHFDAVTIPLKDQGRNYWILGFFPVKHHWREKADLDLIKRSAEELVECSDEHNWSKVLLPRPGCGNGQLEWATVKELIAP